LVGFSPTRWGLLFPRGSFFKGRFGGGGGPPWSVGLLNSFSSWRPRFPPRVSLGGGEGFFFQERSWEFFLPNFPARISWEGLAWSGGIFQGQFLGDGGDGPFLGVKRCSSKETFPFPGGEEFPRLKLLRCTNRSSTGQRIGAFPGQELFLERLRVRQLLVRKSFDRRLSSFFL